VHGVFWQLCGHAAATFKWIRELISVLCYLECHIFFSSRHADTSLCVLMQGPAQKYGMAMCVNARMASWEKIAVTQVIKSL